MGLQTLSFFCFSSETLSLWLNPINTSQFLTECVCRIWCFSSLCSCLLAVHISLGFQAWHQPPDFSLFLNHPLGQLSLHTPHQCHPHALHHFFSLPEGSPLLHFQVQHYLPVTPSLDVSQTSRLSVFTTMIFYIKPVLLFYPLLQWRALSYSHLSPEPKSRE